MVRETESGLKGIGSSGALDEELTLAYEAARRGGSMPTALNAANEKAVAMFLDRKIRFLDIPEIISECMAAHQWIAHPSLEDILETEQWTYRYIESRW